MAVQQLGFIGVPISPVFPGVAAKLRDGLINPTRDAGKKASREVEKTMQETVQSLERQAVASTRKLGELDRAYDTSVQKRESQQLKLNAAIAEQTVAEEKYQAALKKGDSGVAELARVEKARAKVVDETIKMTKAERDVIDAEDKHKKQLEDLKQTTDKYQKAQADLNAEAGRSKDVFGGMRESMGGVLDKMSGMGGGIGDIGEVLSGFKLGPAAGVLAVASAAGTAAAAFGNWNEELTQSRVSMQNQFGLSADAARDMQREVADALGSGLAGYEETSTVVMEISQTLGDEVAHMGGLTAAQLADDFLAFNQVFERSAAETASTVDVMLNTGLVSSAQEGIDLLTAGMQKVPAAMQDEVFDAVNEYSKHFANMGMSGEEAMMLLVSASGQGQIAVDKVGDAVKELSLNAIDPAKVETLAELGVVVEGLSTKVATGGPEAGEAMRRLAEDLLNIEDPAHRAEAAVVAFGTPVEDLGPDQIPGFLEALASGGEGMGDFAGSAQTMADNTTSTFTGMFNSLKGRVHGWTIDTTLALNEWAGEAVSAVANSEFSERVSGMFKDVKDLGTGVRDILFAGDYTGLPFGLGEDSGLVDFLFTTRENVLETKDTLLGAWAEITAAFTGGDWGYGALADLIGEDRAQELVDMLSEWGARFEEFKTDVTDTFEQIWSVAEPVFTWLKDFVGDQLSETLESLWNALQSVGGAILEVAGAFAGTLWNALMGALSILQSLWDFLSPVLLPLLQVVAGIVGGVLVGAFMGMVGAVRVAAEIIEFLAGIIAWVMSTVLSPLISLVGVVARILAEVLAGAVSSLGDQFASVFAAIGDIWDGFMTLLNVGKDFIVATVFGGLGAGLEVVRDNFSTIVDAIAKIWGGLMEVAAVPVRFVVGTVWNNGLLKAVEAIARFIPGVEAPDPVVLGFARGGILPGFSRMADGDDQLVPMRQGEGVLISEALQDEQSRRLFLDANEQAKKGKSFAAYLSDFVAGYARGGIVGSLVSVMSEFYPELQLTSHYRPGDSGYHGKNMAGDFSNTGAGMPSTPAMQAAAKFMYTNYGDQLEQLIHHPARNIGRGMDVGDGFGFYGAGTMHGHTDHIHLAALRPLVDPSGVVQMVPYDGSGGGWFNPLSIAKGLWDAAIGKIAKFQDDGGWFSQLPGAFLSHVGSMMWNFLTGKIGSGSYDGAGGSIGNAESWREMAVAAMSRNGFNADDPAQVNAMLAQIMSESGGNPSIAQQIVDVNGTGESAGVGLLQIIPGTFAAHRDPSLPDDRRDPWANMNAALRYYKSRYGMDLTEMWGHGHGYADGGIVDLAAALGATKFDVGGLWKPGTIGVNLSGEDEFVLKHSGMKSLGDLARAVGELVPAVKVQAEATARFADSAEAWLAKAVDFQSDEGITARQTIRRVLDLGIDLPGASVVAGFLDAEEGLWASRTRHMGHLDNLREKEEALEKARKAAGELGAGPGGLSKQDSRKLEDAQKALDEAKAEEIKGKTDDAKAESAAKRAERIADAEEKLARVREDIDESSAKSAEKHAEDLTKANADVAKAEQDLLDAKKAQIKDLDNITVISQQSIEGLIPQAQGLASQLIGMGAPVAMVAQGLGQVTGVLSQVAAFAGPAGISLGMVLDAAKIGIQLIKTIVGVIREIIERVRAARLAALKGMADGWKIIAEYADLVVEMQRNVSTLQQDIVRGLNEQRVAEFNLRIAQHGRRVAELEGAVVVAEARLALDREIARGNIAAQLRLMGLHEDWDTYLSYQAMAASGLLNAWSDTAISALFTYEAARARALQGELTARVEQIQAEAALATATRQNLRNQQDLLTAQERLIRMSAEVAGIDLVGATATSQVADLVVQMAELQQKMDSNWAGRAGAFLGTSGPWSNEYRGQQALMESYRKTLDIVLAETGVSLSDSQIAQAIDQMKWVAGTNGDPLAVLRTFMPELIEAETALKVQEVMAPIDAARDAQRDAERDIEDFLSEIDLFDQVQPLEEVLQGLEYTIAGLDASASAWASGNEELRAEYLRLAAANADAARDLGVQWQLDRTYATPGVQDQIVKEVTVVMDGEAMYTASQVDALLAEVTGGTNVQVTTVSSTTVAAARRGVMA